MDPEMMEGGDNVERRRTSPPNGTSEQVLRKKNIERERKQNEHIELLKEARKVAYKERVALEAKMKNGGRTPGR